MCASARSTSASNPRAASGLCPEYQSNVPIKRCIIFSRGFLVKLHRISGHEAALPNCACGLPTTEWSLPCQSPDPRDVFRSPLPKPVERPRLPYPRGWKSANPPTLPVPPPRATTPALTICKLPLSSASCSPRWAYSNAPDSLAAAVARSSVFIGHPFFITSSQ